SALQFAPRCVLPAQMVAGGNASHFAGATVRGTWSRCCKPIEVMTTIDPIVLSSITGGANPLACMGDYSRFCSDHPISDRDGIAACLTKKKAQLTPACRANFPK